VGSLGVPAWLVDAARLRVTLDELRDSLSRPGSHRHLSEIPLGYPRDRILLNVIDVVGAVRSADVDARRALADFVVEYVAREELGLLQGLVHELTRGWDKRVLETLGTEKAALFGELAAKPAPDVLSVMGKENSENAHSDILRWLLDPRCAPTVAPAALDALVARLGPEWSPVVRDAIVRDAVSVRRELRTGRDWDTSGELDRIDLVISGPNFCIAIEKKLWSREHSDQTTTYWRWLSPMPGLRAGLFLSPSGMPATCEHFRAISHLELVGALLEAWVRGETPSPEEETIAAGYLRTLGRHVLRAEMRSIHATGRSPL
jgi:hypothetical protein